jgi:hypothetical protein
MSKKADQRAAAAERLLTYVDEHGDLVRARAAGFTYVTLTRDGFCRSTVTFLGTGHTVTTKGDTPREALTRAYEFHKMKVTGFNDAGRY